MPHEAGKSPVSTEAMFSSISSHYDRMNRVLSLGMDRSWRKSLAARMPRCTPVLDVACGSGDVSLLLQKKNIQVTGLDPSLPMLLLAREKGVRVLVCGRAEQLPFRSGWFTGATAAFGVRNFDGFSEHLREVQRVLTDGGTYGILEFNLPRNPVLRIFFSLYRVLIPLLGWAIARSRPAYRYLSRSIRDFSRVDISARLEGTAFFRANVYTILGGVVILHLLKKGDPHGNPT